MTDHPNGQSFTIANVTFRCWIVEDGQRYEWRSLDGRLTAGRNVGLSTCWARAQGRHLGSHFKDLKTAMFSATQAIGRAAA